MEIIHNKEATGKMHVTRLQKAKIVLALNFVTLFVIVVSTPFFITQGTEMIAEEGIEGIFLGIEMIATIFIFRHYDAQIKRKEEEAILLNVKFKKKERELLSSLEYLGKVNVQISMIRSLFEAMRVPSTKNQLHEMYTELLHVVSSVTKEKEVSLRTVNLKTKRTVSEHTEFIKKISKYGITIGNSELVQRFNAKERKEKGKMNIFYSDAENFCIKTFIFVPHAGTRRFLSEERMFLEAIANQCEIMFLLFSSRYYRG
ncbi:MAG: hypothetical protein U9M90_00835 [Patescibacteria group bacterium]|nr:hypothetical protein [Patescibacteria group bacterium]